MVYPTVEDPRPAVAVAGPFTLRDLFVVGGGAIVLLGSILPFQVPNGLTLNVWALNGMLFNHLVSLGLPLAVAGAFAWRRLTGRTRVVVGSLTLDQLASVVSVLTALYFFISTVLSVNVAFVLGLLGALVMLAGTTAASVVPGFAQDFAAGEGHVLGRPVRPTPTAPGHGTEDGPAVVQPSAPAPASGEAALAGQAGSTEAFMRPETSAGRPDAGPDAEPGGAASKGGRGNDGGAAAAGGGTPVRPVADGGAAADGAERASGEPRAAGEQRAAGAGQGAAGAGQGAAPDVELAGAVGKQAAGGAEDGVEAPGQATTALPTAASTGQGPAADGDEAGDSRGKDAAQPQDAAPQPEPDDGSFEASRSEEPAYQAFWFAVPQTRQIIDENTGSPVFTVEPGSWILALEDRGDEFLVQDTDGRIGVLRDLANIERA